MKTLSKLTSKESFAILHEIEKRECPSDEKDFFKWRQEKDKERMEAIKNLIPKLGLGCTICYYSDKRAATVTKIISPCKIKSLVTRRDALTITMGNMKFYQNLKGKKKCLPKEEMDIGLWKDNRIKMEYY